MTPGIQKGRYSFLVASSEPVLSPVLSTRELKTAWLTTVCGLIGFELNKRPSLRAEEIFFTDMESADKGRALVTNAATCKTLQRRAKAGEITGDEMYKLLNANLKTRRVEK